VSPVTTDIPDDPATDDVNELVTKEERNTILISDEIREENGIVCLNGNFELDGRVYFNRHAKVYGLGTSSITNPNGPVFQSDRDINNEIAFDIEINNLSILDSEIAVYARDVDIRNGSTLSGNDGAIRAERNVSISSSTLTDNEVSDGDGGAIYALGNVSISANSTLSNNVAIDGNGGAIYAEGGVTVTNSTLLDNTAYRGGAIEAGLDVTVSNSTLSENSSSSQGGAIFGIDAVTISNSTFSGNSAGTDGGAIVADGEGDVNISGSTLSGNSAERSGGALFSLGAVNVLNSSFSNNTADEDVDNEGDGGAVYASQDIIFSNIIFSGNSAVYGGAIYGTQDLTIENSTLSDNGSNLQGGAIYSTGELTVSSTEFSENTATDDGGGAIWSVGTSSFDDATFSGNTSGDQGGALHAMENSTFTNSRLTNNEAIEGGAVYMSSGNTLTITTSTLTSNRATAGQGGAVRSLSPVDISGSTLSGNRSESAAGGAVWSNSSVTISANSTLNNNFADQDGGAVMTSGTLDVSSSTLSGNISHQHGGALRGFQNVTILDSTLSGNEANWNGGALYVVGDGGNTRDTTVTNSTFADNKALGTYDPSGNGGAIYGYGTITSSRSTFTNNSALLHGGAIFSEFAGVGGTVNVSNSTLTGNKALDVSSEGGAIHAHNGEVFFSTFVNNTASTPPDEPADTPGNSIYKAGTGVFDIGANIFAGTYEHPQLGAGSSPRHFTDLGGNLFSTSSSDETDIAEDPELDPELQLKNETSVFSKSLLSLFGASTPTLRTFTPNSSGTQMLGLAAGSPALSIVPNNAPFTSFTQDQRGTTRTFPASAGAFQGVAPVEPTPTPTSTSTPTSTPASAPVALASTGTENPFWFTLMAVLVTALGSIAAGVSYKLRRRVK
jgi:predicted outer membrane repeat protein